ncbi:hypothetical protein QTJ16_000468 [Diplocarpon rosae]|uniref:Uncharacterized protein n=1 Tax=Diplocarpon rosae TaxID=946125 RepID=A0AAD9T428_9HELO|nr:hypothetical protein QTJ16_000468 [Diplocarpon rosae]
MSMKKDMRRADLIIPYQTPVAKEAASNISATLGSTLPMAAMFTRNKFIGWASVVLAIQNWLGEGTESKSSSSQPAYFSVGMGREYSLVRALRESRLTSAATVMALVVVCSPPTYLPMFLPPPHVPGAATGTEAPAAAPLS